MCVWTLLRVAFFFWARPRKTGDTGCSEQGGTSYEREQSTGGQFGTTILLRGLPLVRWSPMREGCRGQSRWSRFVREARSRGQAGRAGLLLGGDALSHRSVVQGGIPSREGRCRRASRG